jgi:phage tail sheath protein FI
MPAPYRTPGVYVEEISTLPPSIAEVATAVPAFVGYTEIGPAEPKDKERVVPKIVRISTMLEYHTEFGGSQPARFTVSQQFDVNGALESQAVSLEDKDKRFALYYALQHYFRNGGGPCYVVSVGTYATAAGAAALPDKERFRDGIDALEKEDEPTLIVLTDAASLLSPAAYYDLCTAALAQCKKLGDRFTIIDVMNGDTPANFRTSVGQANLMYGAAYYPYLKTSIPFEYEETDVTVKRSGGGGRPVSGSHVLGGANGAVVEFSGAAGSTPSVAVNFGAKTKKPTFKITGNATLTISDANDADGKELVEAWAAWVKDNDAKGFNITQGGGDGSADIAAADVAATPIAAGESASLAVLKTKETASYNAAKALLADQCIVLPPSAAMAGIYARVDREQGVWKAPANVSVMSVLGTVAKITNAEQDELNVDAGAGKSINAIRDFTGKGTLVWGSRTLAGNDNEWRYVPVRRLFITIEESAKKASAFAVFEPNDQGTWLKVKAMIESYLYGLWERGALAGAKPEQAYYVHVGLGTTMTPQDVLEGRMVVEIGIAAVRPAEFIVLKFSHKLQTA